MIGDRAIGFGAVGPITFMAIDRYAERAGIVGVDEFERFSTLIRAMDVEWRQFQQKAARPTTPTS